MSLGVHLPTLDLGRVMVLSGFTFVLLLAAVTLLRAKRFGLSDLSAYAICYLAGSNLPMALWLCFYAFNPDPPAIATKLHGCEKYVGLAGVCFLIVTLTTIRMAFRRDQSPTQALKPLAIGSLQSRPTPNLPTAGP